MEKEDVIAVLNKIKTKENSDKIDMYIARAKSMDEEQWSCFLQSKNIQTLGDLEEMVNMILNQRENENNEFVNLNDIVMYGNSGDTIHIHLIPKDARNLFNGNGFKYVKAQLIDALEKISVLLETEEYKEVKQVYAVSGLIRKSVGEMFDSLGFDVKVKRIKEARQDEELSVFTDRFKEQKALGRAKISKEKLLSEEWKELKDKSKKELEKKLIAEEETR